VLIRFLEGLLRRLSRRLVRGPHASQVLADLDEVHQRDLARGIGRWRALGRRLVNVFGSAWSLWRGGPVRPFGASLLDLKVGWRMLWKYPLITSVSVLSLAIGIPIGFGPSYGWDAIEAPLPVEEGARVVGLRHRNVQGPGSAPTTIDDLAVWRESLTTFEALGAYRQVEHNLIVGREGVGAPVDGAVVTASTFPILRVPPLLGRTLVPEDEEPGGPPAVVIGEEVWRTRLAGDPDVVGRVVQVAGVPHTVVGVMPAGFLFPEHQGMWLPLRDRPTGEPGVGAPLRAFGRLADGATEEAAQREVDRVHDRVEARVDARLAGASATEREPRRAEVLSFAVMATGGPKGGMRAYPGIWLVQVVALVLLGVACANVGLLIFARTATRASELAVRTALGASRARIVGQVFVEALVLALLSAGLGLLLLAWLPPRLVGLAWSPDWGGMPWWFDFGLRPATVVRALLLAVVSAALASALPALRLTRGAAGRSLQRAGAGGWSIRFGNLSTGLIVADVAVAIAVVGMCVGVADRMRDVAAGSALEGIPAEEYLAVRIELPEDVAAPADSAARARRLAGLHDGLVERLAAERGVLGVAAANVLPRMDHPGPVVEVEGVPAGDHPSGGHEVESARVVPGFFAALGRPVVAGRAFGAGDLEGDRTAVIVDTNFVERVLAGRNPIGRRLRYAAWGYRQNPGPWHEIVGVVPALGTNLIQPEEAAGVYHPAAPGELASFHLAVHAAGDPMELAPRVRAVAAEVEPAAMVAAPRSLDTVYPEDWYLMAVIGVGWSVFALVLLALAGSGIYAIMSFTVAQRTREIGIRGALGAGRRDIAATVGRRAALQLGLGALLGMPLAGRIYFSVREDPSATLDAFVVGAVPGIAVMLAVGVAACSAPMLRALRITPTEAMRGAD
jgi:predicted permease